jgi:nitrite reductase/ring-hydroxylating ferredoxin subunit
MTRAPAWQDDFPVSWVDDHFVTRREFTRSLAWASCASFAATAGVAALSSATESGAPLPRVRVAAIDELPIGGSRVFAYPHHDRPCIVIRRAAGDFVAFSQACTHLGCPVLYQRGEDRLECPCHAGFFSATDGRVLAGPPPWPLPRIELEERDGALWAVGIRT